MVVSPKAEEFVNDIYSVEYETGKSISICFLSESFMSAGVLTEIEDCVVQLGLLNDSGVEVVTTCPSIIGMGNKAMKIVSDDPELLGQKLSRDNIDEVYLELYV